MSKLLPDGKILPELRNDGKPLVMRRLAEVGMKVICRQSGLTATIDTIFPNRFIYSTYDEPTKNSGDGVATTARGLMCVDGAEVMHPNGA